MVNSIALPLSLLLHVMLHVHQIGGGFLRFNDPEHMTAPLELEDLDPGSYDELIKYNPNLAAPFEDIRYGGDTNQPFDWSAPEIEAQEVELVREPNEFMYKEYETEGIAEENRDGKNLARINRAEIAKISNEIRDEAPINAEKIRDKTDVAAEKNKNIKKIAEENRNETNLIAEKNRNKIKAFEVQKPSSLIFFANPPVWLGNTTLAYVQENQTNVQDNIGWNNWMNNKTSNKETDIRETKKYLNLAKARQPKFNTSNKKTLRKQVWPKSRSYSIETPWDERTLHDHHIDNWDMKKTHDYDLTGTYTASCYRCGELNYGKWWRPSVERRERNGKVVPTSKLCDDAFQGDDWRSRTKARHMRSRCYNNEAQNWNYEIGDDNFNYYHECVSPKLQTWLENRTYDSGNPVECFGRYTGKCFKRFLDVGRVYTERGCASWPPHQSNSFASHRFTKMEHLLYGRDNACVSSPLASLTPFDSGVSLYVRYHVCVCTGRYCNAAANFTSPLLLLFTFSFLTFTYGSWWL